MYAERRLAFEKRIGELLSDHRNAYPASRNVSNNQWRDIASRILSALEDSFQMGKHVQTGLGDRRESGTVAAESDRQSREIPLQPVHSEEPANG
jgi:hypothetical protein